MYTIFLTEKAKGFIKKMPVKERSIVLKKLSAICHDPFRYVKKLQGNKLYRLRIMDYRAIVDIIIAEQKIYVVRIGHRKNVYNE